MKKSIEEILDICLEQLKQGVPLDEVLQLYPQYREELKELLIIAKDIENASTPPVRDEAIAGCLIKIGQALQLQKEKGYRLKLPRLRPLLFPFPSPVFARVVASLMIVIFVFWGTANLSANSLPGDILYPVKLVTEKVKFFLTINPENKIELRLVYSEERTAELVKHIAGRGELNTQLLQKMLNEAYLALEEISRIPEDERGIYFSKLEYLSAYQRDVLESLKPRVVSSQKEVLDKAIQTCGNRMNWMGRMRKGEVPDCRWGPQCYW